MGRIHFSSCGKRDHVQVGMHGQSRGAKVVLGLIIMALDDLFYSSIVGVV